MHTRTKRFRIRRADDTSLASLSDQIAIEEPMELRLSWSSHETQIERSIAITMRTPGDDFDLAAGFLLSEGIVRERQDIAQITYCTEKKAPQTYNVVRVLLREGLTVDPERLLRHFYTSSSCGVCGKASLEALEMQHCPVLPAESPQIELERLYEIDASLNEAQEVFSQTGGLHAAALFDAACNLLGIREDVGRHNALDKLIGTQFLAGALPLSFCFVWVSGRVSFELVQKALMAGIPMIVAVGAPSSLAVQTAREFGMTLIGFARGRRLNVYAGSQRLLRASSPSSQEPA